MISGKKGFDISDMITPRLVVNPVAKVRAYRLGRYPNSSTMARIRSRVSDEMDCRRRPLNASETADNDTPAHFAMSFILIAITGICQKLIRSSHLQQAQCKQVSATFQCARRPNLPQIGRASCRERGQIKGA